MTLQTRLKLALPLVLVVSVWAAGNGKGKTVTVKGYVLDSACAFTKNLDKPISRDCALACARKGSPLVILASDGAVYWPISNTTPAIGQNQKLLKFAGQKVTATGSLFERGGSRALVIEKIEAQ